MRRCMSSIRCTWSQIGYSKTVIGLMWSLGVVCRNRVFLLPGAAFPPFARARLMLSLSLLIAVVRFADDRLAAPIRWRCCCSRRCCMRRASASHHAASVGDVQRWFSRPLQARGQAIYISISYGLGGTLGGLVLRLCVGAFGRRCYVPLAPRHALRRSVAVDCAADSPRLGAARAAYRVADIAGAASGTACITRSRHGLTSAAIA